MFSNLCSIPSLSSKLSYLENRSTARSSIKFWARAGFIICVLRCARSECRLRNEKACSRNIFEVNDNTTSAKRTILLTSPASSSIDNRVILRRVLIGILYLDAAAYVDNISLPTISTAFAIYSEFHWLSPLTGNKNLVLNCEFFSNRIKCCHKKACICAVISPNQLLYKLHGLSYYPIDR